MSRIQEFETTLLADGQKGSRGEFRPGKSGRDLKGKFCPGNTQCYLGWEHLRLLFERLGGTEADRDKWWRLKALYHSDKPYWGTRVQKFFDPGTPKEYLDRVYKGEAHPPLEVMGPEIELPQTPEIEF